MKEKIKTVYVCTSCGEIFPKWMGKCSSCGEWNSLVEDVISTEQTAKNTTSSAANHRQLQSTGLDKISINDEENRILTGISELDRVLGGGIVVGSVVLLGGEPGAGKSTLLLQLCGKIGEQFDVLYITGEESVRQIKMRAARLGITGEGVQVAAENDVELICRLIEEMHPGLVVIDSIQTMHTGSVASSAGSVSQVKECAAKLLATAKSLEIPTFIVGHVNKDGAIAGPKVMEHIVDTVLYFEGDRMLPYRILRAVKNRYGSTNEIGMFDMTGKGLQVIDNPSGLLLEGRPIGISGNCVACTMEGTRPILSEVQALITKSGLGTPRRAASGFDFNRMNLLLAVMEKRAGFFMGNLDVYVNIVGGLRLDDTACDLAFCLAAVSSILDKPIGDHVAAIGEVGLGGEIRAVNQLEQRVKEAVRIGFTKLIVPQHSMNQLDLHEYPSIEICGVSYLKQAIEKI